MRECVMRLAILPLLSILCAIMRDNYCEIECFIVQIKNFDNKYKTFIFIKCVKKTTRKFLKFRVATLP